GYRHYEDVLAVRVHGPVTKEVSSRYYERINAFEQGLAEHETLILKFYLHISKEEQLRRFKERLEDPSERLDLESLRRQTQAAAALFLSADSQVSDCCLHRETLPFDGV